ncbi:TPA: ATP-binding cassette domain-containing protein [Candidatus Bathyarchaeota archaeon]|nr:ATP-binding cassette domain-containing protein [Candidatus Bathyarchaeota archaeon]
MAAIEIRNLTYKYQNTEVPVLQDLNLTIEKGEFVLVSGPSGCGKTTLCRCLNGLIPHFYGGELEGKIYVEGLNVRETPPAKLASHVGLIFQNPENQLFSLNVERDIAFGLENLGIPPDEIRRKVEWALELVGILDLKDRAPWELSGGQQQKAAIACVLAMQPSIIIFDEPTSFLDPLTARGIFDIIAKLRRELNLTIVVVEHRLETLAAHASRLIFLDQGKIVLNGEPRKVLAEAAERLGQKVSVPNIVLLHQRLSRLGILKSLTPLTVSEMAAQLRGVLGYD